MKANKEYWRKISIKLLETPCAKIAKLWESKGKYVICNLCERRCKIPEGMRGMCGARFNYGGELYTLTYGNISAISNNPMSKKPFFNFKPDKYAITVGSWGCNFICPWCQNWEISKFWVESCHYLSPEKMVELIGIYRSDGTSFSFNEPLVTLFEYSLDVMPLARRKGYFNTYVSNAYMTPEALDLLVKNGLDAINIDIKGCKGSIERWTGANIEVVWRNAKLFIEKGVHVEITTLVIPKVNDDEACLRSIARRIKEELGKNVPWHVTRYFAAYKAREYGLPSATPVKTLEKAYRIGKEEGLEYVYIGNVPGHEYESTYCPNCGRLIIWRFGLYTDVKVRSNRCPNCGYELAIKF